jgi:hypothetical protein
MIKLKIAKKTEKLVIKENETVIEAAEYQLIVEEEKIINLHHNLHVCFVGKIIIFR